MQGPRGFERASPVARAIETSVKFPTRELTTVGGSGPELHEWLRRGKSDLKKFTLERIEIHATSRHASKKIQKTYGGVSFEGVQSVRYRGANKGTLEAQRFLPQGR